MRKPQTLLKTMIGKQVTVLTCRSVASTKERRRPKKQNVGLWLVG